MESYNKVFGAMTVILLLISGTLLYLYLSRDDGGRDYPEYTASSLDRFDLPEDIVMNETLRGSLRLAGDYLVGHIRSDGKWEYQYDAEEDRLESKYNILRHAGTTYSLALLFKYLHDLDYYNGSISTLNYLFEKHLHFEEMDGMEVAYTEDNGLVKLGGAALAILAVVEIEALDPDVEYEREMDALGNFLVAMQYQNGSFQCFYKQRESEHSDYYPGEALLAFAKLYDHTGDRRYLDALKRGLDHYNEYYPDYYTAFTPWGTEANVYAYSWLNETSYMEKAYTMAKRCQRGQITPDDDDDALLIGAFSSDPKASTASRLEAIFDSYLLAKREGDQSNLTHFEEGMELGARFLMNLQLNWTDVMELPDPWSALGGYPESYDELTIRIDYVQHSVVVLVKILVYKQTVNHI